MDEQGKYRISYDDGPPLAPRHVASFAASIAAHAAIVGLILLFASPLARPHNEWVLAYLVEMGDGNSGKAGALGTSAPRAASHRDAIAIPAPPTRAAHKMRRPAAKPAIDVASLAPPRRPVALARPSATADEPAAASSAAAGSDTSGSGDAAAAGTPAVGSADRGTGNGAGGAGIGTGDSDSIAHADYASDPAPDYPAIARRREQQGTVTVRALVGADGTVQSAEIAKSSGFDTLDRAALETVRSRWRFVPARHGGIAVESWVLVPIRFTLVEADAVR